MTNKSAGKLLFQGMLLLILLFSLVRLVMVKDGSVVVVELVVLAFLLMLSVVGLATYKNSGNKLLFAVFLLYTGNLLVLWAVYQSLYLVLFLVSLIGIWLSLPRRAEECGSCDVPCEPASSSPPQKVGEAKVVPPKAEAKIEVKETAAVKTKFTPGKYVASKRSNVYHEPKCEWAKKIQKDRQLWFADRKEALNKGYKKHSCVQ